jgi:hypothetical protein
MSTTSMFLSALGSFYVLLAISLTYRASKPNCRTCLFWQHCLRERTGFARRLKDCTPCLK